MYKEVTTLTADPPDGIKVFPNEEDLTDLQVTIEGPGELVTKGRSHLLDCSVLWLWNQQDSKAASQVLETDWAGQTQGCDNVVPVMCSRTPQVTICILSLVTEPVIEFLL